MEQVARGLRLPVVAAPLVSLTIASTAAGAAKVGLGRLAWLGWGAAGSTVIASGVVLAVSLSHAEAPPSPPAPAAVVEPLHQNSEPPRSVEVGPAPEVTVAPLPSARVVRETPATWDEPQLIEKARRALASDPRRALSLAQEHQRRFPSGALGVEREVILVEALARAGRSAEAKRRALAFEARYANSIHLPRVRALLARL
jgi:hypothetical protein